MTQSLFDLTGKVALITGSSKGIGEAIARQMAAHGAKVVISSRKLDVCEEVAASINAEHPDQAIAIACNISSKEELVKLVDGTRAKWGRIDSLICNAAVNPYFGSSLEIPDKAFERVMDTNIKSNHWLTQLVLPEMVQRKDGSVIIISSIGGLKGSAVLGAYGISKAADSQMVRNLATEFGPHNIRVNAISPGLIKTKFARALWDNPDILKASTASCPLRRIGMPDEIAGAAVYLAAAAGNFTNGHTLVIDGGSTIA